MVQQLKRKVSANFSHGTMLAELVHSRHLLWASYMPVAISRLTMVVVFWHSCQKHIYCLLSEKCVFPLLLCVLCLCAG